MMKNFDFNLLIVAESVYRTSKLTQTGAELGLSQSAVSHALKRLNELVGRPLFVRGTKGMVATDYGMSLRPRILQWDEESQSLIMSSREFDPFKVSGRVVIAATEYFEAVFGPKILSVFQEKAPKIQLSFLNTLGRVPKEELESGSIDLAIAGFFRNLPEGYFQSALFEDSFAVVSNKSLSKTQYLAAKHLLISISGDFEGIIDQALQKEGKTRQVVCASSSFLSHLYLLKQDDFALTAPKKLIAAYQELMDLKVSKCPVDIPGIKVRMIWHLRSKVDPLKAWARSAIQEICSEGS